MKYTLGRTKGTLVYYGYKGTYIGAGTQYYGVRVQFRDENGLSMCWDTTYRGMGILHELKFGESYEVRFTVDLIEEWGCLIKRVTLVK